MSPKYERRNIFPRPDAGTNDELERALDNVVALVRAAEVEERTDRYYVTSHVDFGVKSRDGKELELKFVIPGKSTRYNLWDKEDIDKRDLNAEPPFTQSDLARIDGYLRVNNIVADVNELSVEKSVALVKKIFKEKVDIGGDKNVEFEVTTFTTPNGKEWVTTSVEDKEHEQVTTFLNSTSTLTQARVLGEALVAAKDSAMVCSYPKFALEVLKST
jgi:hypothetical protein